MANRSVMQSTKPRGSRRKVRATPSASEKSPGLFLLTHDGKGGVGEGVGVVRFARASEDPWSAISRHHYLSRLNLARGPDFSIFSRHTKRVCWIFGFRLKSAKSCMDQVRWIFRMFARWRQSCTKIGHVPLFFMELCWNLHELHRISGYQLISK